MTAPFKLGILGLGFAGATMLEMALRHDEIEVVAVADPNPDLRNLAVQAVPRTYAGVEELVADPDIDGAYVATPTRLHLAHSAALLGAGKHVIVEKPLAARFADAAELVQRAGQRQRALIVGHSQSFEPYIRLIPELARQGGYGRLTRLLVQEENDWMRRPRLPEELDEEQGGGPIYRQGAHLIDVARFLTGGGEVRGLRASGVRRGVEEPYGSFIADFVAGPAALAARCTISFNGWAASAVDSPVTAPASTEEAARKKSRNQAVLGDALAGTLSLKLAQTAEAPGRRSIYAMYENGDVTVHGRTVRTREGVVDPEAHFPNGRRAVLDELLQETRDHTAHHNGTWGLANLRVTVDLLDQIRSGDLSPQPNSNPATSQS